MRFLVRFLRRTGLAVARPRHARAAVVLCSLLGAGTVGFAAPDPTSTAVSVDEPREIAIRFEDGVNPVAFAEAHGLTYIGNVGELRDYHLFRESPALQQRESGTGDVDLDSTFDPKELPTVAWAEVQEKRWRYPRQALPADPLFRDQWHLRNTGQGSGTRNEDARVVAAWDRGYSGAGVRIAIVDDGVQVTHPEFAGRYSTRFGLDVVGEDSDPSPEGTDRHGTAVAGIPLAGRNAVDGVGIAYNADLAAVRLLGAPISDADEASALSFRRNEIDIYNNSWGPSDLGGARYAGPSELMEFTLSEGARFGRTGRGSIFVWACGNGRLTGDNSNYDGYSNSRYTIAVGAVGQDGTFATYSEPGANVVVVAPSQGRGDGILTTDNTGASGYAPNDVFNGFNGTSAAAPMVAGVAGLMLEANSELGWRDVQHILIRSAARNDPEHPDWVQNGAGRWVNHQYGFGRVHAGAAVALAESWTPVPAASSFNSGAVAANAELQDGVPETVAIEVPQNLRVEHVEVTITADHTAWPDLEVVLTSPSGTESVLAETHAGASGNVFSWTYLSVRHWDESSEGTWLVQVLDGGARGTGSLESVNLVIHGTPITPEDNRAPQGLDAELSSGTFPIEFDTLSAATDPDGDELILIGTTGPANGELADLGNGVLRYTMDAAFRGSDTFGYILADSSGQTLHRLVHVTNPLPAARNDVALALRGEAITIPVTENDFDPDGDTLVIESFANGARGFVTNAGAGSLNYQPSPPYVGWDRFRYTITDNDDGTATGWVTTVYQDTPDFVLSFDGEDDEVVAGTFPSYDLRDNFTIEAWFRADDWGEYVTGFGRLFDKSEIVFFLNGFDHPNYNDQSLVLFVDLQDGSTAAANSIGGSIELDRWHHVAVRFNSAAAEPVTFFVDGVQVDTEYPIVTSPAPAVPILSNTSSLTFIGESISGARAFSGEIAFVRAWSRLLSAVEIAGGAQRTLVPQNQPLLRFDFHEGVGRSTASTGSLALAAEINGALWRPRVAPWAPIVEYFTDIEDSGTGWWFEPSLGWIYADPFPWVYDLNFGWLYAVSAPGDGYLFRHASEQLGWIFIDPDLYPWLYSYQRSAWILYLRGTSNPSWFFDTSQGGGVWFPVP